MLLVSIQVSQCNMFVDHMFTMTKYYACAVQVPPTISLRDDDISTQSL